MIIKDNIKIPFHLCDPAKILFFGSIYEIYHVFLENHIESFGIKWEDWFKAPAGAPIRGLTTSFNSPLYFGETYEARWSIEKITDSTISFNFIVGDINKPNVELKITHCFIDTKTTEKAAVPNKIKSAFLKHLTN